MIPTRPNGDRPAFPTDRIADEAYHANGLTKREIMAGLVLTGMRVSGRYNFDDREWLVAEAYKDADLLLSYRARTSAHPMTAADEAEEASGRG